MGLSFLQKRDFYHQLGQLVRSGVPFPKAIDTLAERTRGAMRAFLDGLRLAADQGETVGGAFGRQSGASAMERSILAACAHSGRLDEGCRMLSDYFATLEKARASITQKLAYPLFMLHFGVFVLGIPTFITSGAKAYLWHTVGFLGALWIGGLVAFLGLRELQLAATWNPAIDRLVLAIPFFGKLRRAFVLARFCATYDMQLEAGINVIDSLTAASGASHSAAVAEAVRAAMPEVRTGAQVGPLLGRSHVFPDDLIRAWRVGEETGGLDKELRRKTVEFEEESLRRMEVFSNWLPKLIYIAIMGYLGYEIISLYAGYLRKVGEITDGGS